MKIKILSSKLKAVFSMLFLLIFSGTFSQTNLVSNCSFETSTPTVPVSGGTEFYVVPTAATIANWTYISGDIDLHHSRHHSMGCPPGAGKQHIDLNDF